MPHDLHPSYAPKEIIPLPKFDSKNQELWVKAVLTSPAIKNKVVFIDGTIRQSKMKKGVYLAKANTLIIVNSMVTSWILNVIEPK